MKKQEFTRILHHYIEGTANDEEKKLIETYYSLLLEKSKIELGDINNSDKLSLEQELLDKIWGEIKEKKPRSRIFRLPPALWKAVACLVLIVGGVMLYRISVKKKFGPSRLVSNGQNNSIDKIEPGGNVAVLTLANGKKVLLGDLSNGALLQQGGIKVIKQDNGLLTYKDESPNNSVAEKPIHNTLTTPRGGQYEVILADGTKVWLNAASSLEYPVSFSGENRTVEIHGEGYFEVASGAHKPFIVKVDDINVEVLGTSFDVNSYEENSIKTTLVDGAIKVTGGAKIVLLKPGEVARFNRRSEEMKVADVNVNAVTAWKDGLFYFDHTSIKEIMDEVSRWYDVEVSYSVTDLKHKVYDGKLPRYGDVNTLLKMLEMTGTVHFEIKGRTIIVTN